MSEYKRDFIYMRFGKDGEPEKVEVADIEKKLVQGYTQCPPPEQEQEK